jgi:hypothetical protein
MFYIMRVKLRKKIGFGNPLIRTFLTIPPKDLFQGVTVGVTVGVAVGSADGGGQDWPRFLAPKK